MLGTIRSVILCVGVTLVRRVFKYQFTHFSIKIFYSNKIDSFFWGVSETSRKIRPISKMSEV